MKQILSVDAPDRLSQDPLPLYYEDMFAQISRASSPNPALSVVAVKDGFRHLQEFARHPAITTTSETAFGHVFDRISQHRFLSWQDFLLEPR